MHDYRCMFGSRKAAYAALALASVMLQWFVWDVPYLSLVACMRFYGEPKGDARPGWLRGDVAAQYLNAASLALAGPHTALNSIAVDFADEVVV